MNDGEEKDGETQTGEQQQQQQQARRVSYETVVSTSTRRFAPGAEDFIEFPEGTTGVGGKQGEAAETAAVAASPSNSAGHGDKKLPRSSSSNKETSAVDEEPDPYDFNSLLGKPRPYKVGRY